MGHRSSSSCSGNTQVFLVCIMQLSGCFVIVIIEVAHYILLFTSDCRKPGLDSVAM